jgi:uncharacterized protein (DUF1800 family)
MRRFFVATLAIANFAAQASPMGADEARHLLARTGFGPTPAEVAAFASLTRAEAVERLLVPGGPTARTAVPDWVGEFIPLRRVQQLSPDERKAFQREQLDKSLQLRAWWLHEMLTTDAPLTERMTLFWHNHFVSSQQKVRSPVLMYRQNLLLRRHALGNFRALLHAIARDPAMVVYLDSAGNRRGRPNENFARELMELFTLGEGQYTEADIKEAARAFTGWSLERDTGEFRFYRALHDDGEKTVLGRRGHFDGDAVLDILLDQPAAAEFLMAKLWREFISPVPEPGEVQRLARVLRAGNYDIKPALRALLTSEAFYAPAHRAALIKSPVELVVGSLRQLAMAPKDLRGAALATRGLGQDLFAPPNVKGWPGGTAWINSHTLLARKQLLERLLRAREMPRAAMPVSRPGAAFARAADYRFDAETWFARFPGPPAARRAAITQLLLAQPPVEAPTASDDLDWLRALVLDPVYQLK